LENQNKKEEYLRKISSIKRINTEEEVHFERRDNEISKSPDDVKLKSCNIIKELWTNKCDFIFALLSTLIYGIIIPFNGYIKGHGLQALSSKYTTIRYDNGLKYSLIFLLIGCFKIIVYFIMNWTLENLGINLSKIYRKKMMKKYISFHMSFFDIDRNSPGSLLSKMSIDTVQLHIFINKIIGIAFICFSLLVTSIILGFCYEYRLTLITLAFLPFLLFITFLRRLILQVDSKKSMEANMEGGRIISECVTNTKIIFSYNFTKEALNLYLESIDYITQKQIRDNIINGLALAIIYFSSYLVNAAILIAGKILY
jgi:ABC-type multidrug transport system fused ATPase/permease subunit